METVSEIFNRTKPQIETNLVRRDSIRCLYNKTLNRSGLFRCGWLVAGWSRAPIISDSSFTNLHFLVRSVNAGVITLKPEGTFCEAGRQIRDRTWNQLFSGHVVDTSSSITPFRFTIIQLFLLVTCLAFSLASFSWYWHIANDTVDERTIPIQT